MNYGEKFREIRKALNLKQGEFADLLEYKRNTVSMIENGKNKPTVDFLIQLFKVFNINPNWFFNADGKMFLTNANASGSKTAQANGETSLAYQYEVALWLKNWSDLIEKRCAAELGYSTDQREAIAIHILNTSIGQDLDLVARFITADGRTYYINHQPVITQ